MNRGKLVINVLKFVPFIMGVVLCSIGIINLFSSLLLFCGGYLSIKNLCDYRQVKKNINDIRGNCDNRNDVSNYIDLDNGIDRVNTYSSICTDNRVKKRVRVRKR